REAAGQEASHGLGMLSIERLVGPGLPVAIRSQQLHVLVQHKSPFGMHPPGSATLSGGVKPLTRGRRSDVRGFTVSSIYVRARALGHVDRAPLGGGRTVPASGDAVASCDIRLKGARM